jgi:hypothetical protein
MRGDWSLSISPLRDRPAALPCRATRTSPFSVHGVAYRPAGKAARHHRTLHPDPRIEAPGRTAVDSRDQTQPGRPRGEPTILRLSRLRLRGPRGAQFEFTLAAIAQNLRRMGKLVPRPPPVASVACFA